MKPVFLAVLTLCVLAQGAINFQNEIGDSVQGQLDLQEINLKAASPDISFSEDDQLLSTQLSELERNQGRNIVADAIQDLLNGFRDIVINGNDDVPPLDPLVVAQMGPFEYRATGVRANIEIRNFNMQGLRWYVVDHVTFNALRLALGVQVTIPHITFTGSYDARAVIALLSHSAGGNFRIFINRLETSVDARLGTNILGGGHLFLRELNINIVIHDVSIQISGMVGSNLINSFINSWVQSATQNLLANELEDVSRRISEELFDIVDDVLRNFTLDDLLR